MYRLGDGQKHKISRNIAGCERGCGYLEVFRIGSVYGETSHPKRVGALPLPSKLSFLPIVTSIQQFGQTEVSTTASILAWEWKIGFCKLHGNFLRSCQQEQACESTLSGAAAKYRFLTCGEKHLWTPKPNGGSWERSGTIWSILDSVRLKVVLQNRPLTSTVPRSRQNSRLSRPFLMAC